MKEHALPQDVTGYQFHIIGNMTIKQFAEVGAGVLAGFLIYSTNLTNFLKWPLILTTVAVGAFAAFVPFEERPFDHWIVAFFQALYRPTQFYWKRNQKIPEPFLYKPNTAVSLVQEVDLSPARKQRVKEYLRSINTEIKDDEDVELENQANSVINIFQSDQPLSSPDPIVQAPVAPTPAVPTTTPPQPPQPQQPAQQPQILETPAADFIEVAPIKIHEPGPEFLDPTQQSADENAITDDGYIAANAPAYQPIAATRPVVHNTTLPFPDKPTEPNKLVGMILDQQDNPISDVIVEIVTQQGMPARAVKTNLLGQFFIATPLNNGTYTLKAEKDGLRFEPQQLIVDGNIIEPVEVRSS